MPLIEPFHSCGVHTQSSPQPRAYQSAMPFRLIVVTHLESSNSSSPPENMSSFLYCSKNAFRLRRRSYWSNMRLNSCSSAQGLFVCRRFQPASFFPHSTGWLHISGTSRPLLTPPTSSLGLLLRCSNRRIPLVLVPDIPLAASLFEAEISAYSPTPYLYGWPSSPPPRGSPPSRPSCACSARPEYCRDPMV